jgi:hypothetical protein
MEIYPIKAARVNADKRTNIKQISVSATIAKCLKIYCDSRGKRLEGNVSVALNQQSLFCYLPLTVHKDICSCQLREILSPQKTWYTFRAEIPVTENYEQQLTVILWPHIFLNTHICSYCER